MALVYGGWRNIKEQTLTKLLTTKILNKIIDKNTKKK